MYIINELFIITVFMPINISFTLIICFYVSFTQWALLINKLFYLQKDTEFDLWIISEQTNIIGLKILGL